MSPITTHVLDTSLGRPAAGVEVKLARWEAGQWQLMGQGVTNNDGRITDLLPEGSLQTGTYRITFETAAYFAQQNISGFYPFVPIIFEITAADEHYHVPLLLNPYGYSTYRGS